MMVFIGKLKVNYRSEECVFFVSFGLILALPFIYGSDVFRMKQWADTDTFRVAVHDHLNHLRMSQKEMHTHTHNGIIPFRIVFKSVFNVKDIRGPGKV